MNSNLNFLFKTKNNKKDVSSPYEYLNSGTVKKKNPSGVTKYTQINRVCLVMFKSLIVKIFISSYKIRYDPIKLINI